MLGGDCGILLGAALGLNRRGRYGLAFLDGHSDFRHPGNSPGVGAADGEDLALVTGRGQPDLTDIEGRRRYFRDEDVVVLGVRDHDDALGELRGIGVPVWETARLRADGPAEAARAALAHLERDDLDGFWVHLDAEIMPTVDSPDPGGIGHEELRALLAPLVASPACAGVEVTVFDPDPDPDLALDGRFAAQLTGTLVRALSVL